MLFQDVFGWLPAGGLLMQPLVFNGIATKNEKTKKEHRGDEGRKASRRRGLRRMPRAAAGSERVRHALTAWQ